MSSRQLSHQQVEPHETQHTDQAPRVRVLPERIYLHELDPNPPGAESDYRARWTVPIGIRETDLYNNARPPKHGLERKLDLLDLALDKFIHPGLLISVGIEDGYTWKPDGRPAVRGVVRIPYLLEDGTPYRRNRIRTAKTHDERL